MNAMRVKYVMTTIDAGNLGLGGNEASHVMDGQKYDVTPVFINGSYEWVLSFDECMHTMPHGTYRNVEAHILDRNTVLRSNEPCEVLMGEVSEILRWPYTKGFDDTEYNSRWFIDQQSSNKKNPVFTDISVVSFTKKKKTGDEACFVKLRNGKSGKAICKEGDVFDPIIGFSLAYMKAKFGSQALKGVVEKIYKNKSVNWDA